MRLAQLTARLWRRTRQDHGGRHRPPEVSVRPLDAAQITAVVASLREEPTALAKAVQRHLEGETRVIDWTATRAGCTGERDLIRGQVAAMHRMQGWH